MDLSEYAGKAIGLVDGRIVFKSRDPEKVMKRLMAQKDDKEVALTCVPSSKTAMVL